MASQESRQAAIKKACIIVRAGGPYARAAADSKVPPLPKT